MDHSTPQRTSKVFTVLSHSPRPDAPRRKYIQSTIIKDGILEKWTNYLGTWRARYFILEPGVLKYANSPGQPIKETYPLVLCSTRFCAKDTMCLELEHSHGVLYLRMPTIAEKREWVEALLKAKNAFQLAGRLPKKLDAQDPNHPENLVSNCKQDVSPVISIDGASSSVKVASSDSISDLQGLNMQCFEESEKPPMTLLLEHLASCTKSLQSVSSEVRRAESTVLRLTCQIRDQQFQQGGKVALLNMVKTLEHLNMVMQRYLSASEMLALDEQGQRAALENFIAILARDYYEMNGKLDQVEREVLSLNNLDKLAAAIENKLAKLNGRGSVSEMVAGTQCTRSINQEGLWLNSDAVKELCQVLSSSKASLHVLQNVMHSLKGSSVSDLNGEKEENLEFFDICEEGIADSAISPTIPCEKENEQLSLAQVLQENNHARHIQRRTRLPTPRTESNVSLWTILKNSIGQDLSRIVLPVYFNEPSSFVQRLAEDFQYCDLLRKASKAPTSLEAFIFVAAFSITPCASTIGRTYKPFNSLLGETYELSHRGFRFLAEQVSHHPPITAYSVKGDGFDAWGHLMVKTRFTGKSAEITLYGPAHIVLSHESSDTKGDHFTIQRCKAVVNNVIFGKLSLEMFGTVLHTNHVTGECCVVEYLRSGWWTNCEPYGIRGVIFDSNGTPRYKLGGRWNNCIWSERIQSIENKVISIGPAPQLQPSLSATEVHGSQSPHVRMGHDTSRPSPMYTTRELADLQFDWVSIVGDPHSRQVLWHYEPRGPEAFKFYEFTQFAMELNEITPDYDPSCGACMPPTDSRFRMDQRYLEEGKMDKASEEKERLENSQRKRACMQHSLGLPHTPRWFKPCVDSIMHQDTWVSTGEYYKQKEEKKFTDCFDIFR